MPQTAYVDARDKCSWKNFLTDCDNSSFYQNPSDECMQAINDGKEYLPSHPDQYDVHNIYAPTCHPSGDNYDTAYYINNEEWPYYPCMREWSSRYMNRMDVQQAIHAINPNNQNRTWPHHPNGWQYGTQLYDETDLYQEFMMKQPNWKISIVDGDADPVEPLMAEQKWIQCLGRKVVKDWKNWYYDNDVAGSVKVFDGITFQTVKHCGHMISTYCPSKGFQFFQDYVNGTYSSQSM